jgi:polysaccharide export outer membrane protein
MCSVPSLAPDMERAILYDMKYFAIALVLLAAPRSASAQPQPTPSQAAQLLQQPGLAGQVRSRIAESGLTPQQIRARLQAAGYSATLLDAYLGTAATGQADPTPGREELAAIRALGLPEVVIPGQEAELDTGLVLRVRAEASPVFGVDVFRRTTTQFLPTLSGPVPADYRLGPGDNLVLILTGDVELAHQLQVTREGFILIPQVGQVHVANLTVDQLRSLLFTRLGRVYSGVTRSVNATTRFDITVASVRAVQVYVVGEVAQPGAYLVSSLGTVLTSLYAAGGVTERSNMRAIELRRPGASPQRLDLYDYLLRGDTRHDVRVQTGDVVFVPVHGTRAEVRGAVIRPYVYELAASESLTDLVAAAGGFRADAVRARVSLERLVPAARRRPDVPPRVVIEVPLGADGAVPALPIEDGDVVLVDSLGRGRGNYVQINGSVYQPGRYGLEPGMRLSRLVSLAGGFRPATYAGRAHIERLNLADSTRSMLPVALPSDSAAPWPQDLELRDYDVVTIYGRPEMRDSITVAITGMVNQPGRFLWREGMTLRDLVLMARGPTPGAYLVEAEIARLPADRSRGQMATTTRVPLDSTYLFDRDSLGRYIGPPGLPVPGSGAPEVRLDPYDNVLILRQPDFEFQRTVAIFGEVQFPGRYALRAKDDRLVDLVQRAGGLTPRAYPEGIRFIRREGNAGRINIDLPRAQRNGDDRNNIILQPGDSVYVPEYLPSVRVAGAVNSPGSVLWRRGAGLSYYIEAAGGYARLADRGGTSVRQPNGEVQKPVRNLIIFRSEPQPGPGAEVTVPARDPADRTDVVGIFTSVAQLLTGVLTLAVVLTR